MPSSTFLMHCTYLLWNHPSLLLLFLPLMTENDTIKSKYVFFFTVLLLYRQFLLKTQHHVSLSSRAALCCVLFDSDHKILCWSTVVVVLMNYVDLIFLTYF